MACTPGIVESRHGGTVSQPKTDRQAVHEELEAARATFHALADHASTNELDRRSAGTRWTNRQLLFHMLFGYLIVRTLLGLVRMFGRLPPWFGRTWSRVLNSATRPFHVVNYLGSVGGALVLRGPRLTAKLDRVVASLHRKLDLETDDALRRGMAFPTGWDPYFRDHMSLLEVYHYGTQHFDHHRAQLTFNPR
jgi:hypothetical protein